MIYRISKILTIPCTITGPARVCGNIVTTNVALSPGSLLQLDIIGIKQKGAGAPKSRERG